MKTVIEFVRAFPATTITIIMLLVMSPLVVKIIKAILHLQGQV